MKVARFVCPFVLLAITAAMAQNPVPFLNQPLVPTTTAPGGPGFTLTVNGTEFVSGAVVNWNGTALATTFVTGSQVTAAVPASDIAMAGTASVTVTNPAPGGGVSNVMYFDIANQAASLVFSSLYSNSPGSGYLNSMITADFNGDGKLDLASLAYAPTNALVIALGNGDGTFQSPVQYADPSSPVAVVTGDFNGDGKLDVAVANNPDNTVSIFLGNGDGTFQAAKTSASGGQFAYSVAAGDFNGDGKLDLVVASYYGISILLGNGDGTFQTAANYDPSGDVVYGMAVGDFNGDGILDIVLSCYSNSEGAFLFVLFGNGDGTFQLSSGVSLGPTNPGLTPMIAADLNGDGKLDFVMSSPSVMFSGVGVFIGNGDGTFQPAVGYSVGPGATNLGAVLGDFNADGKLDVAAATFVNSDGVSILLGNGDGTFQLPTLIPVASPCVVDCFIGLAVAADFNGDGKTDLAGVAEDDLYEHYGLIMLQGNYAALASTPSSVVFAQQNVSTSSAPQAVTVTNTGNAAYNISSIGITGANAGDFSQNNACGATLTPNASCQVNVTFTPRQAGVRNAGLSVTGNSFPLSVPLIGTGVGTVASLSPPAVTFPAQYVGTSGLPQTVTLNNTGGGLLTIASVTASPADFAPLSTCGNSLAAGASCSIGVFFDPAVGGTRTGTLTVTDSAGNSPQTATLTGVGQDFSMTSSGSSTATVSPGGSATYQLAVAPAGGFKETVSLTCTGAPAGFTCSVPSPVTLNGSSATMVTVTVSNGSSARLARPTGLAPVSSRLAIWLAFGGLHGLVILGSGAVRRRSRRILCGLACLFLLAITWVGCGGGGGGTAGSYSLMVTGKFTSGATTLTHDTVLTLVVQ